MKEEVEKQLYSLKVGHSLEKAGHSLEKAGHPYSLEKARHSLEKAGHSLEKAGYPHFLEERGANCGGRVYSLREAEAFGAFE